MFEKCFIPATVFWLALKRYLVISFCALFLLRTAAFAVFLSLSWSLSRSRFFFVCVYRAMPRCLILYCWRSRQALPYLCSGPRAP